MKTSKNSCLHLPAISASKRNGDPKTVRFTGHEFPEPKLKNGNGGTGAKVLSVAELINRRVTQQH